MKAAPARRGVVVLAVLGALALASALGVGVSGCSRSTPSSGADEPPGIASARAAPAYAPRLDWLRRLGLDLTVRGRRVRAVALYANAPDYAPASSPSRDGSEGVACVDDAARAAVVWLRDFEVTGDAASRDEASRLLDFVVAMEQGDGELVNFVRADGTPNTTSPTSAKSFSYWAARATWALAEGVRVLGGARADELAVVLDRLVARLGREVAGGALVAGSVTATSEALLGVLAYERARPSPERRALASRLADVVAATSRGDATTAPYGAHVDPAPAGSAAGATWHAWGARAVEALAEASVVLARPELANAARREVDGLWKRLDEGGLVAEIDARGGTKRFPQIAYGVSPIVEGYLALARALGDPRYAALAGKTARWFFGDNPAHVAMVDEATGRVFDGIDGSAGKASVNRNAGAESNVEALLALGAVAASPEATRALEAKEGEPAAGHAERVELVYWPAANPIEVELARKLVARFEAENPDVSVRVQPIPAGRSSEEVLLAAIVARATPDVCSNVSSALLSRLVRADGVVRLDTLRPTAARLRERATVPMLASFRTRDGGLYALPWKTNPEVLLYNVDALAAAGVEPPRTHGDLGRLFGRLARDADGDGRLDHWAMAASPSPSWFERFNDFYPLYLTASGGATLLTPDGRDVAFDTDAAAGVVDLFRRGFAARQLPRSQFSGRDPFVDGTVALKIIGPWFLERLAALAVPGLRYEVAPLPVPDGVDPHDAYTFGDVKSIAVFSTTRHAEAAGRLVAFLTSVDADRLLVETTAQLPYRRGLARDARFASAFARWHGLDRIAERVEHVRDVDVSPDLVEVFDILSEAYEASAVYDRVAPREAIAAAARESRAVLRASR